MPVMARKTLRAPRVRLRGSFTANKMVGAVGLNLRPLPCDGTLCLRARLEMDSK
jgi:hypothetical protein